MSLSSAMDIAASGLAAARERLTVSAHNVANVNTDGFRASRVVASPAAGRGVVTQTVPDGTPNPTTVGDSGALRTLSNTDIVTETVEQLSAMHAFMANLAVVQRTDETTRHLIDTLG